VELRRQEYAAKLLINLEDAAQIRLPEISPKYRGAASELKRYDTRLPNARCPLRAVSEMKDYEISHSSPYSRGLSRVPSNKGYLLTPSQCERSEMMHSHRFISPKPWKKQKAVAKPSVAPNQP